MFSKIRGLFERVRAGQQTMDEAWQRYVEQMEAEGMALSSYGGAPEPGTTFWISLTSSGRVQAEDATILRRRVAVQHFGGAGALGPVDAHHRPIPFERQTLRFSGDSGCYFGLEVPKQVEHLIKGHPDESRIRAVRAGKSPPRGRPLAGVPTKTATVYAVANGPDTWKLTVDASAGGTPFGQLSYSKAAKVIETHVIFGPNNWPAAQICALLLTNPKGHEDGMVKSYAEINVFPEWAERCVGRNADLMRRFSHDFYFDELRAERTDAEIARLVAQPPATDHSTSSPTDTYYANWVYVPREDGTIPNDDQIKLMLAYRARFGVYPEKAPGQSKEEFLAMLIASVPNVQRPASAAAAESALPPAPPPQAREPEAPRTPERTAPPAKDAAPSRPWILTKSTGRLTNRLSGKTYTYNQYRRIDSARSGYEILNEPGSWIPVTDIELDTVTKAPW